MEIHFKYLIHCESVRRLLYKHHANKETATEEKTCHQGFLFKIIGTVHGS